MPKLNDYIKITSGFALDSNLFSTTNGFPVIRIRDVDRGFSETFYLGDCDEKYIIKGGDLLITMDGEFRLKKWTGTNSYLNQRVCKVESNSDLLINDYLVYLLPRELKKIEDQTPFVTVKHLSINDINNIEVELPTVNKQKFIVDLLDKADSIRKKRQESIRLADEFLRSTFLDMFGDPVVNTMNWDFKLLDEICLVTKLAGYEYTEHIDYKDEGEIIVIRGLNVKEGRLRLDKVKYIDKSTSEFLKRSKLNKDDVVMTYIGVNIGDVAIVPESGKYHLAPNVAKITPKDFQKLNSIFLMRCLQFNRMQFSKFTTNTAKQAFNMANIRQVEIPLPPIGLQDRFARIVEKIELIKEKYQLSLFESENLFNSLMQRAFRGEL